MPGIDFEREGLLDGCESDAERADRRELLERLADRGVPLEELREAIAQERLVLLPVELRLRGEPRYTLSEVAERTGLGEDFVAQAWRALGLSLPAGDQRLATEQDLEAARRLKAFLDAGLPPAGVVATARVIGQAVGRIAAATRDMVGPALASAGDTELELARRYADAMERLGPLMDEILAHEFRTQLLEGIRRDFITAGERRSGRLSGGVEITAAFADLVGFTRLGEKLPATEIGGLASRLAEIAAELVEPPVELVKTIGDAVMMVSDEPAPLVSVSLRLVAHAEALGEEFPALRAGLALGDALPRAGDWYGRSINRAARITQIARPASVLVDAAVREAVGDDGYSWSFAGERRLKGIEGGVRLFRVRQQAEAGARGR